METKTQTDSSHNNHFSGIHNKQNASYGRHLLSGEIIRHLQSSNPGTQELMTLALSAYALYLQEVGHCPGTTSSNWIESVSTKKGLTIPARIYLENLTAIRESSNDSSNENYVPRIALEKIGNSVACHHLFAILNASQFEEAFLRGMNSPRAPEQVEHSLGVIDPRGPDQMKQTLRVVLELHASPLSHQSVLDRVFAPISEVVGKPSRGAHERSGTHPWQVFTLFRYHLDALQSAQVSLESPLGNFAIATVVWAQFFRALSGEVLDPLNRSIAKYKAGGWRGLEVPNSERHITDSVIGFAENFGRAVQLDSVYSKIASEIVPDPQALRCIKNIIFMKWRGLHEVVTKTEKGQFWTRFNSRLFELLKINDWNGVRDLHQSALILAPQSVYARDAINACGKEPFLYDVFKTGLPIALAGVGLIPEKHLRRYFGRFSQDIRNSASNDFVEGHAIANRFFSVAGDTAPAGPLSLKEVISKLQDYKPALSVERRQVRRPSSYQRSASPESPRLQDRCSTSRLELPDGTSIEVGTYRYIALVAKDMAGTPDEPSENKLREWAHRNLTRLVPAKIDGEGGRPAPLFDVTNLRAALASDPLILPPSNIPIIWEGNGIGTLEYPDPLGGSPKQVCVVCIPEYARHLGIESNALSRLVKKAGFEPICEYGRGQGTKRYPAYAKELVDELVGVFDRSVPAVVEPDGSERVMSVAKFLYTKRAARESQFELLLTEHSVAPLTVKDLQRGGFSIEQAPRLLDIAGINFSYIMRPNDSRRALIVSDSNNGQVLLLSSSLSRSGMVPAYRLRCLEQIYAAFLQKYG